jgi:hypothetical protein
VVRGCAALSSLVLSMSCQLGSRADLACQEIVGEYDAVFSGSVNGLGTISLREAGTDRHKLQLRLAGPAEAGRDSGVVMELAGRGTCKRGVFAASVSASDQTREGYKVLGGTLVAVLEHELSQAPFGRWTAEVMNVRSGTTTTLLGFWHAGTGPAPGKAP